MYSSDIYENPILDFDMLAECELTDMADSFEDKFFSNDNVAFEFHNYSKDRQRSISDSCNYKENINNNNNNTTRNHYGQYQLQKDADPMTIALQTPNKNLSLKRDNEQRHEAIMNERGMFDILKRPSIAEESITKTSRISNEKRQNNEAINEELANIIAPKDINEPEVIWEIVPCDDIAIYYFPILDTAVGQR